MTATTQETTELKRKSFCCYLPHIARVLMGLGFFVFGLNGFLNFIPPPKTPMPEGAAAFAGALMKTGYMFQMIAGTQLLVGVLLDRPPTNPDGSQPIVYETRIEAARRAQRAGRESPRTIPPDRACP